MCFPKNDHQNYISVKSYVHFSKYRYLLQPLRQNIFYHRTLLGKVHFVLQPFIYSSFYIHTSIYHASSESILWSITFTLIIHTGIDPTSNHIYFLILLLTVTSVLYHERKYIQHCLPKTFLTLPFYFYFYLHLHAETVVDHTYVMYIHDENSL